MPTPEAHHNLGRALMAQGKLDEAARSFERAIALKPDFIDAYNNLAQVFYLERWGKVLDVLRRATDVGELPETKRLFMQFLHAQSVIPTGTDMPELMARALTEAWDRPRRVVRVAAALIKQDTAVRAYIERATNAWPKRLQAQELLGSDGLDAISGHRLLACLLETVPAGDLELERFLTGVRFAMLALASDTAVPAAAQVLELCCRLARQCFLNEYVFAYREDELAAARKLREQVVQAAEAGAPVPEIWLALTAAYFPLHSLPAADALLGRAWSGPVTGLLDQQVREWKEEQALRASIPALTAIEGVVSQQVRRQYEENPYPRWVKPGRVTAQLTIDQFMRTTFPLAPFRNLGKADIDVLIAGCGTGQQAVETAQLNPGARVLAIDLSLSSLAYAKRKTRAFGLDRIEYAQADILKLASSGRTFDVIEATGVLHHLADPFSGWRVLVTLLRAGGVMRVGLYSELARSPITAARAFIAERGYRSTADDIRRCRQELLDFADGALRGYLACTMDFFSTSECRDLLFHVQEHRHTLPQIADFLAETGLEFLGFFPLDGAALRNYRHRFPRDAAMTDLGCWHVFETENPHTFAGMYQFWVQKKKA